MKYKSSLPVSMTSVDRADRIWLIVGLTGSGPDRILLVRLVVGGFGEWRAWSRFVSTSCDGPTLWTLYGPYGFGRPKCPISFSSTCSSGFSGSMWVSKPGRTKVAVVAFW